MTSPTRRLLQHRDRLLDELERGRVPRDLRDDLVELVTDRLDAAEHRREAALKASQARSEALRAPIRVEGERILSERPGLSLRDLATLVRRAMHARNGALPTIKVVRAELQDRFAKKVGRFGTGTTAHRGYASSIATT